MQVSAQRAAVGGDLRLERRGLHLCQPGQIGRSLAAQRLQDALLGLLPDTAELAQRAGLRAFDHLVAAQVVEHAGGGPERLHPVRRLLRPFQPEGDLSQVADRVAGGVAGRVTADGHGIHRNQPSRVAGYGRGFWTAAPAASAPPGHDPAYRARGRRARDAERGPDGRRVALVSGAAVRSAVLGHPRRTGGHRSPTSTGCVPRTTCCG